MNKLSDIKEPFLYSSARAILMGADLNFTLNRMDTILFELSERPNDNLQAEYGRLSEHLKLYENKEFDKILQNITERGEIPIQSLPMNPNCVISEPLVYDIQKADELIKTLTFRDIDLRNRNL